MRPCILLLAALTLSACDKPKPTPADASPSASSSTASTAPSASSSSSAAAAATKPPPEPYKGPTGTLSGTVRVTGDPAPSVSHTYPKGCDAAAATYGKLFRTGQDKTLADALVAITHYKGHVPPKSDTVSVTIRDCAFSTRTIALTDGQHIELRNLDVMRSYLPYLDGARAPAKNVAVPRGPAIKLHSRGRQRYWLRDQMGRNFMTANVFHFPYSTTSVTGLDGQYRIEGVPVGEVQVSVMLPSTKNLKHISQKVTIKQGDNKLALEFPFDAAKDTP